MTNRLFSGQALKRVVSTLLAFAMSFSALSVGAFARIVKKYNLQG